MSCLKNYSKTNLKPLRTMTLIFKPLNPILIQILPSMIHFTNHSHFSSQSPHTLETVNKLITTFNHHRQQPTSKKPIFEPNLTPHLVETALKSFKNWEQALKFFHWAKNQDGYVHNCYTYNAMATILSGVRQNAAMRKLCNDLVEAKCYVSPGALGYFVRCLGGLGMVNEANEFFDRVKEMGCVPNEYSYNALLEAISKDGLVDLMAVRMSEMRENGWECDKFTLTSVLQCYCRAGKFDQALEVFRQMGELGWVDDYVFTILVISLTKGGEVDKAIGLIDKMDRFKVSLNEKTFYVLIHGFVKNGNVDHGLSLLKRMQSSGFVPGISLYAVLIEGFCGKGEFTKALQLYSQMKETGIIPDVSILKNIVSSLTDEKEMVLLLKEAKDHVNEKSMTTLLNTALFILVKSGSIDKASHLLRTSMKDDAGDDTINIKNLVSLDASSFEIVVDGLLGKGDLDMALDLVSDMDQIGCKRSLLLYNNLINALSDANKVEKCHELLKEMKANGFAPSQFTHNSIFGYYCKFGNVEGALNMLREMRAHGHKPWIKHYTLLVKKLSTNRKVAEACSFMAIMSEIGFMPDMIAYAAAIDGWLKIGEVDYAWKMFKNIFASGRFPDIVTYNTIISGLCKAKRVTEARDIYDEMVQKGLIPSVVTYNLLIDAYCKDNDIDQAVGFFSRMTEKKRNPNVITYSTLIDGLCNTGRSDEALLIWNQMVCSPNRIAYMVLVNGLCKCGKPDAALYYVKEMEEKHMTGDAYVYVTLVDAFISVSNAQKALYVLKKMIQNERLPFSLDKNCGILKEAVAKLLDDIATCSEVKTLIADGKVPIHLLQTEGS